LHTVDFKTAWTSVYGFFILKSKTYIKSMAGTGRRLNLSVLFKRDSTSGLKASRMEKFIFHIK